jgi:hypothetical protein
MAEHPIDWYQEEFGEGSLSDIVSHQPGVLRAVDRKARTMGQHAEMLLARHRRKGHASIEVIRHPRFTPGTPDWYVIMKDPDPGGEDRSGGPLPGFRSAMSIEFGWNQITGFNGARLPAPIHHEGLHILGAVMVNHLIRYTGPR